jgi:hypothetical protein
MKKRGVLVIFLSWLKAWIAIGWLVACSNDIELRLGVASSPCLEMASGLRLAWLWEAMAQSHYLM